MSYSRFALALGLSLALTGTSTVYAQSRTARPDPAPLPMAYDLGTAFAPRFMDDVAGGGSYTPSALSCSINTACEEGNGWEAAISATVKIVRGGQSCTGVLLNNVREDRTPYVLTAYHCGNPTPGEVVDWIFQFDYQSSTCADPVETPEPISISGAVVRAAVGGSADFVLLELLDPIPADLEIHFAGWSLADAPPSRAVAIGHPQGDIKKLTIDDDPLVDSPYFANYWMATYDHGVMESGSSGSPLFNASQQVIGIVKGSYSLSGTCSGPGGDDNAPVIYHPKLSYLWTLGLSDYLDPDGSGSTSVASITADAPASIWINEINAAGSPGSDDEFIELVGPANTPLAGYTLDVYSCASGNAALQASFSLPGDTLENTFQSFGLFVLGGNTLDPAQRDASLPAEALPDDAGVLVLRSPAGKHLFDYRYDDGTQCPASYTRRSAADAPGSGTMGFTTNAEPSAQETASAGLFASPKVPNFDGGQVLPVELVAFTAEADGPARVHLAWQTASETNNAGFAIERRAAEHTPWQEVAFLEGQGTTLEAQHYAYDVSDLAPGRHWFRLRQVDFDGTVAYSPAVEVVLAVPAGYHLTAAYPNPFNPETQFSVVVARRQRVEVGVYDVLGREVARLYGGELEANQERVFRVEGSRWGSGVYVVRVEGEYFLSTQTITLLK